MLEFKGTVEKIFDEAVVGTKGSFRKREFVVLGGNDGKQYVTFTAVQTKCDLLKEISEGESITVQFLPKGRKWAKSDDDVRYYNSLEVMHILTSLKTKGKDSFDDDVSATPAGDDWLSDIET